MAPKAKSMNGKLSQFFSKTRHEISKLRFPATHVVQIADKAGQKQALGTRELNIFTLFFLAGWVLGLCRVRSRLFGLWLLSGLALSSLDFAGLGLLRLFRRLLPSAG